MENRLLMSAMLFQCFFVQKTSLGRNQGGAYFGVGFFPDLTAKIAIKKIFERSKSTKTKIFFTKT